MLLLLVAVICVFVLSSCVSVRSNKEYITDYSKKMEYTKKYFPEIYDLYIQGKVVIDKVYFDKRDMSIKISYDYR